MGDRRHLTGSLGPTPGLRAAQPRAFSISVKVTACFWRIKTSWQFFFFKASCPSPQGGGGGGSGGGHRCSCLRLPCWDDKHIMPLPASSDFPPPCFETRSQVAQTHLECFCFHLPVPAGWDYMVGLYGLDSFVITSTTVEYVCDVYKSGCEHSTACMWWPEDISQESGLFPPYFSGRVSLVPTILCTPGQ